MKLDLSIIIPNWNGRAYLQRCVSAAVTSAQESGLNYEVLVIDDCSSDGSEALVPQDLPMVSMHRNTHNLGFGATVNKGAQLANGEILVLLNNDLIAKAEMIRRLCAPFTDPQVFGVSAKTVSWENHEPNHVNMRGRLERGRFRLTWSDDSSRVETMFLQGGSCAVRRDLFLKFGGFNPLFAPGYWEDYDISYLALKAGYRNLYEPGALGLHLGQGSMIRAHGSDKIARIRYRNAVLFTLLNFTDRVVLQEILQGLPGAIALDPQPRMLERFRAFGSVIKLSRAILHEREKRSAFQQVSDQNVLEKHRPFGTLC